MATQAQRDAVRRYKAKRGRIDLRPPVELEERFKAHADRRGESVQALVIRAMEELLEREK